MNAITKAPVFTGNALMPTDMRSAMDLASMMARAKLVPTHLQDKPGDCLRTCNRAKHAMGHVSVCRGAIHQRHFLGKLMFEGKLVSAAVQSSGILSSRLAYDFDGEGASRAVTVRGTIRGEDEPRTIRVTLAEAKTTNGMWQKQPDQQLVYFGTRAWARRHTPEIMLGVYSPEEMEAPTQRDIFTGTTIQAEPLPATPPVDEAAPAPRTTQRTIRQWLDLWKDQVVEALALPDPQAALDAIFGSADFKRAEDVFTNGKLDELNQIKEMAFAQLAEARDPEVSNAE